MLEGTVKWYNMKKGYGFIQSEANVKDIFIHAITGIKNWKKPVAAPNFSPLDIRCGFSTSP
ncbi:MAG: cold-shock protein [Alphaproteobacteria bacterium]